jgi:hypothetical protein
MATLFGRPEGNQHRSVIAIQMIAQEREHRFSLVIFKAVKPQLYDVGDFTRAFDRFRQLTRALHTNRSTNSGRVAFHQTQREAMFVCFTQETRHRPEFRVKTLVAQIAGRQFASLPSG